MTATVASALQPKVIPLFVTLVHFAEDGPDKIVLGDLYPGSVTEGLVMLEVSELLDLDEPVTLDLQSTPEFCLSDGFTGSCRLQPEGARNAILGQVVFELVQRQVRIRSSGSVALAFRSPDSPAFWSHAKKGLELLSLSVES